MYQSKHYSLSLSSIWVRRKAAQLVLYCKSHACNITLQYKKFFWLLLQIMWDINMLFRTIWQTAFLLSCTDLSFDADNKYLMIEEKYPPPGWEFPSIQQDPGAVACCGSGKCVQAYPAWPSANPSFNQIRMSSFACVKQPVCPSESYAHVRASALLL